MAVFDMTRDHRATRTMVRSDRNRGRNLIVLESKTLNLENKFLYRKLISNGEYFISSISRICQFSLSAGHFDWSNETMVP